MNRTTATAHPNDLPSSAPSWADISYRNGLSAGQSDQVQTRTISDGGRSKTTGPAKDEIRLPVICDSIADYGLAGRIGAGSLPPPFAVLISSATPSWPRSISRMAASSTRPGDEQQ